jgi:hypothetical protein
VVSIRQQCDPRQHSWTLLEKTWALIVVFAGLLYSAPGPVVRTYTVATLPSGVSGQIAWVSDSSTATGGTTCAGGGSYLAACQFNGTAWVVMSLGNSSSGTTTTTSTTGYPFTNQKAINIAHNLGTLNVVVECYDSARNRVLPSTVTRTDANTTAVTFESPQTGSCSVLTGGASNQTYTNSFTGQTSVSLVHNLGTTNVLTACYDNQSPSQQVNPGSITVTDSNTVTVGFLASQSGSCVVVTGTLSTQLYSAAFSAQTSVTATHNLGTVNVVASCYDNQTPKHQVLGGSVSVVDANTVSFGFLAPQTGNCVIEGIPGSYTVITTILAETVPFTSTPTFSPSIQSSLITLTGNVSSFTLGNGSDGAAKVLTFCQDSTGSRTVAAPANVHGFFTVGATASKCSVQRFVFFSSLSYWLADGPGVINQ